MIYVPWIIFGVIVLALLAFCWTFIFYYMNKDEPSRVTLSVGVSALMFALIAVFLLPVDVNVVGMNVHSDGMQKDYDQTKDYLHDVRLAYYVMYGCLLSFAFFWLPLAYFYYEAIADQEHSSTRERCSSAFKYSLAFLVMFAILLLVGFFVKQNKADASWQDQIQDDYKQGENALSFIIALFLCLGFIGQVTYTAYGYAALPINLVSSLWSYDEHQRAHVSGLAGSQDEANTNLDRLRKKYRGEDNVRNWNVKDRVEYRRWERKLKMLDAPEQSNASSSCCACMSRFFWGLSTPVRFIIGASILCLHLLVVISILIHLLDQVINSKCSYNCGWSLEKRTFVNPMNIVLMKVSDYFPVDYIIFSLILLMLFGSTIYGFAQIGVRFFCIRMFDFRAGKTMHNGLLMAVWILIFIILSLNYTIYEIAPDYVTFGSQTYLYNGDTKQCTHDLPQELKDNKEKHYCVPTEYSGFITNILVGYPIFGAFYYICTWLFCLVYFIVCLRLIFGERVAPNSYQSLNRTLEPHFY